MEDGLLFIISCITIFLIVVPLIYLLARMYLQQLLCCSNMKRRHLMDYEEMDNNSTPLQIIEDNNNYTLPSLKKPTDYIVELDGFYYKRNTMSGSKHYLLGLSPALSVSSDGTNLLDLKINMTLDISFAKATDDPRAFWLRVDDFYCTNQKNCLEEMNLIKFKITVSHLSNKNSDKRKVCHVKSDFMTHDDARRHVFKLCNTNSKNFSDLVLQLKVRGRHGTTQKKIWKLGRTTLMLEDLDPLLKDGNVLMQRKTLIPENTRRLRGLSIEKPIL